MDRVDTEDRPPTGSSGTRTQPTRQGLAGGVALLAGHGGTAAGYSARAVREASAVIAAAQGATVRSAEALGKAADVLVAATAVLAPAEIPIGDRIRTRKRIRRLHRERARLEAKKSRKVAAAPDDGQAGSTENAKVRSLSEAIRQRGAEIAGLKDKLRTPWIEARAQAGPNRTQRRAASVSSAPARGAVNAPQERAVRRPQPGQPEGNESVAKGAAIRNPRRPADRARETLKTVAQVRSLLEEEAGQAEFALASQKLVFLGAVRDLQSASLQRIEGAIAGLKRLEHPVVARILTVLAWDSRADVRAVALIALTEQEADGAVPLFRQAANDGSPRVRMAALRGLYKVGRSEATPYLVKALADEDAGVRCRAVKCLRWAGVQEAVPNLLLLLNDPETLVRSAVIDALGDLKSRLVVPGLIQALDDENVLVREAAGRALANLSDRQTGFQPDGSHEARARGKAQWEAWWAANRATFHRV